MMPEITSRKNSQFYGYAAWMCSRVGCSWLIYLWVFTVTLFTNSIFFAGFQSPLKFVTSLSGLVWHAYFVVFGIIFSVLFIDVFVWKKGRFYWDHHISLMVLYIAAALLSIIVNRSFISDRMPLYGWMKMVMPFLVCLMTIQILDIRRIHTIALVLLSFACINLPVSFIEMLMHADNLVNNHIAAAFSDRNLLARFLIIAHSIVLIDYFSQKKRTLFCGRMLVMAAIFICISFLLSRSGYLLYLFSTVFILAKLSDKKLKKYIHVFVAAAFILFISLFMIRVRTEKMNISNASDIGRAATMIAGLNMIRHAPVFGIGYSMSNPRFTEFQDKHFPGLSDMNTIHNAYINTWAECGILGLGFFLAFNAGLFFAMGKASKGLAFTQQKELLFCRTSLSVYLIHGLIYHTFDYDGIYWVIISCCVIALRDQKLYFKKNLIPCPFSR